MSDSTTIDADYETRRAPESKPLVSVCDLKKYYPVSEGIFERTTKYVRAVDEISFDVYPGETFAIVGESGCGKTTLGKTIARLLKSTAGEIVFDGQEITGLSDRELKPVRREVQVVYQDPTSSLNPRRRIGDIIAEPLVVHGVGLKAKRQERVEELLRQVDLPVGFQHRYPSALSGGQKQRVAIARAIALNPKLVVLDEPTSALDVSVQAKVISLLKDLQEQFDLTYLLISHDLSLVKNIADRIGVMYLGQFMEIADSDALFANPLNPYTDQLLSAIPTVDAREDALKPSGINIEGETPDPTSPPPGCPFHPRCHKRFAACDGIEPVLTEVEPGHFTRCLLHPGEKADEVAAVVPDDETIETVRR